MQFRFYVIRLLCSVNKIYLICFSMVHKQSCFLILPCCYSLKEKEERKILIEKPFPMTYTFFLVFVKMSNLSFSSCS